MKKFSISYVKQNPFLFVGILIFGVIFWMLLNRGASASAGGGTTVVSSGPSEAELAMGTQVTLAQIGAGVAVQQAQIQFAALAQQGQNNLDMAALETSFRTLELASNERVQGLTVEASLAALGMEYKNSLDVTNAQSRFMIDYATVQTDAARDQAMINAHLHAQMSKDQLEAYKVGTEASKFSAVLGTISGFKKKHQDDALAGFLGYAPPAPNKSGGSFLSGLAGILSPVAIGVSKL